MNNVEGGIVNINDECIVAVGANGQPSIFRCIKCSMTSRDIENWYAKSKKGKDGLMMYCPACDEMGEDEEVSEEGEKSAD